MTVTHSSFSLERTYDAAPARVFAAFADPAIKPLWFHGRSEWDTVEQTMDFRVGGREVNRVGAAGGPVHEFWAEYQDIVPDERIVYTYAMDVGGVRLSASVATIELEPAGEGTRLTFTEQGAFLDDGEADAASRREGTVGLLDQLAEALAAAQPTHS